MSSEGQFQISRLPSRLRAGVFLENVHLLLRRFHVVFCSYGCLDFSPFGTLCPFSFFYRFGVRLLRQIRLIVSKGAAKD
ncbi:hypothetical protein [Bifidobacterium tsurumiense]|uniref:hypothetical protein n=1 Tax=Bifidobacterium tsurumiense TaxID=356829 RepID=UPI00126A198C|nr:hypothetical protein [Bifidobacterium tsurumiense]MDY4677452.1 hypothetical protein [Bifidobacterium tsurumiense]MSS11881.1 hypothetical protein [Bifidobacterium tsurumiense]